MHVVVLLLSLRNKQTFVNAGYANFFEFWQSVRKKCLDLIYFFKKITNDVEIS